MPHYSLQQRIAILNNVLQAGWDMDDDQIQDLLANGTDLDLAYWEAVIAAERTPGGPVNLCHPDQAWLADKTPTEALTGILEVLGNN